VLLPWAAGRHPVREPPSILGTSGPTSTDRRATLGGEKVHLVFEVTFDATNGRVKVTLNDTPIADDAALALPPPPSVTFGIGLDLKGTYPAMTATFDNVTVK
jgi:hypothetical protein